MLQGLRLKSSDTFPADSIVSSLCSFCQKTADSVDVVSGAQMHKVRTGEAQSRTVAGWRWARAALPAGRRGGPGWACTM